MPCLESAKNRDAPDAIKHDDGVVLDHGDYKKVHSKLEKKRNSIVKSQEKVDLLLSCFKMTCRGQFFRGNVVFLVVLHCTSVFKPWHVIIFRR